MSKIGSTNDSCGHLATCKIWQEFKTNSKYFWIKQYCQGPKRDQCARAAAKLSCNEAPDDLLPNGERLG